MLGHIPEIHDRIVDPADRPAVEAWTRNFLRPIAADLGESPVAGESAERAALRSDVFGTLAAYGDDPDLIAKARAVADAYMKAPDSIDAGLAQNALSIAARNGDTPLYEAYMAHLSATKTPAEYYAYLGALTQFPDPALTRRTIEYFLSPAVKNQDLYYLSGPLQNYQTQEVAWELMKADFPRILEKVDASLGTGLVAVAGVFCDARLRDDSQQFFAAQKLPGTERLLDNAKDKVDACIELRSFQRANLSAYLKAKGPSAASTD